MENASGTPLWTQTKSATVPESLSYQDIVFTIQAHTLKCTINSTGTFNAGVVMHESYTKVSAELGGAVLNDTVWSRYQGVPVISHTTVKQFKFSDGSLLHSHFMWSLSINSCVQFMRSIFNLKWFY